LFTVAAFMTLVEQGTVAIDQPVCEVLPEFSGVRAITPQQDPLGTGKQVEVVPANGQVVDAGRITFRHLLAHNSGLPAWLPLWWMAHPARLALVQPLLCAAVLGTTFAYPTGSRVVYSDVGLVLLGYAIERRTEQKLDVVVRERVTGPLGLMSIGFGPIGCDNVAPTEFYSHQNKRMCGEVHDENAWALQGVAGHAGLFGTAQDVAAFGDVFLRGGGTLLRRETVTEMTRLQAEHEYVRRGLGFALWSPNPNASSHPLSPSTFGHLGFTGTSLWIDPARALVVACLTNHIYYGRGGADTLTPFRIALSKALATIIPIHA
jgi:CubicO group peptidase (beta-lactamase class C family)